MSVLHDVDVEPANLGVTLAIGDTAPVTIVLDRRLPAGPWQAQVDLRSGLLERSSRATITFPGAKATSSWPPLLIAGLVGLLALLLAIATLLIARRKRANSPPGPTRDNPDRARSARRLTAMPRVPGEACRSLGQGGAT